MIRQASSGPTARRPPVELGRRRRRRRAASTSASGSAPGGLAVDDDRVRERRQLGADLVDLGDLLGRLADDDGRAGVADDPLALVGRVRRVDGHDDGADRRRREVGDRELEAGVAEHADAVADADAEPDQAAARRRRRAATARRTSSSATRRRAGTAPPRRRRGVRPRPCVSSAIDSLVVPAVVSHGPTVPGVTDVRSSAARDGRLRTPSAAARRRYLDRPVKSDVRARSTPSPTATARGPPGRRCRTATSG